jgi:formylglycine-generating enzyme required for sulfatase activity
MVHVKGGEFQMGCTEKQYKCKDSEKPAHTVEVNDFYLSKYEITNAQYCHFLNDVEANPGGSYYGYEYIQVSSENCMIKYKDGQFKVINDKENHPVVEVTWYGAKAFCHWADGRLPSEAEWEYAARGGNPNKEYIFSGSDTISKVAWFKHNYYTGKNNKFEYREGTLEIGLKEANSLGLHDMSGNVWEFCNDWYSENYYKESPKDNPTGPSHSNYRVKRGGSYKDEALECRISNRRGTLPGYSKSDIGFRLCRDVEKNSINQNNEALSSQ